MADVTPELLRAAAEQFTAFGKLTPTGGMLKATANILDAKDAEIAALKADIERLTAKPPATAQTAEWRALEATVGGRWSPHGPPITATHDVMCGAISDIRSLCAALTQAADATDVCHEHFTAILDRAVAIQQGVPSRIVGDWGNLFCGEITGWEAAASEGFDFVAATARQALGIEPPADVDDGSVVSATFHRSPRLDAARCATPSEMSGLPFDQIPIIDFGPEDSVTLVRRLRDSWDGEGE